MVVAWNIRWTLRPSSARKGDEGMTSSFLGVHQRWFSEIRSASGDQRPISWTINIRRFFPRIQRRVCHVCSSFSCRRSKSNRLTTGVESLAITGSTVRSFLPQISFNSTGHWEFILCTADNPFGVSCRPWSTVVKNMTWKVSMLSDRLSDVRSVW